MQAEALETLVNNHYKGLITAIASNIQDKVEANIRDWMSNELKNMLEHHDVVFKGAINTVSEQVVEDYLFRNDYINLDNFESHADEFCRSKDLVSEDNLNDYLHEWMGNNFDISDYDIDDKLKDAIRSLDFTVEVS